MTTLHRLQRRTSSAFRRAIARLPHRMLPQSGPHREASPGDAETKRWRFVEREAVVLSRLGCDLSSGALSEEERSVAVEHIVRGATRLRQFAEGRLRVKA